RDEAREDRVIQRQHVVFRRLDQEEFLQLAQLFGILGGEVVVFGVVLGDVVELPFVAVDYVGQLGRPQEPDRNRRRRGRDPAIVVDRAGTKHLEILRL